MYVGIFLDMKNYNLKRTEKKDVRISIRVSDNLFDYLNSCSDFFGVSKSNFIRERCLSDSFYVVCSRELPADFMNTFTQIADMENTIAFELNSLYKKSLDTNRLDLIFHDDFFLEQIDRIESCINLWVNEPSNLEDIVHKIPSFLSIMIILMSMI